MEHISKLIETALKPSKELAPSEPKKSAPGALQIALKDAKIYQLQDREPLIQALRYAFMLVGLRGQNLPDKLETELLIQFIANKFGGHTVKEIKLAFEMAVAGKLDVDATCYENFSVLYFSNIMNAYREWAKQEYKELATEPAPEKPIDKLTIDMEYCYHKQKEINKLPVKIGRR